MSPHSDMVAAETCVALGATDARVASYPNREVMLGSLAIARALPISDRRLVGPWCFLDRFGPLTFSAGKPMDVAPHPHIGLQTVTWLLQGEVLHNDSLGSESLLRPGAVNVMTSGAGIAHAEETPRDNSGNLDGVQLWVALPDSQRHKAAAFEHVEAIPHIELPGGEISVLAGPFQGHASPAAYFSEILAADVQVRPASEMTIPLQPHFEHALLMLSGDATLAGQPLDSRTLYYLGTTRSDAHIASRQGGRLLLIGGPPFPERVLMWWNFVARTQDEIAQARADWETRQRFGEVAAYQGARLTAPHLNRFARPNPVS